MRKFFTDSGPAVRVHLESQRPEQMSYVAVWLVKAALLELFHHNAPLHLKPLLAECQLQHPVGLQPEGSLHIRFWNSEVIIGYVIVGPSIVFPSRQLQRGVIIGNMRRTAKHQMLEQMGKTGVFRMLIACTDIIDDVQRHHLRTGILVMHQTQAIGETMFVYFHTQWMKMWQKSIIPSQSLS